MSCRCSELIVPADTAYLDLVGQFVGYVAVRLGFAVQDVARIRLAVDEACANVVLHAAAEQPFETFRVVCEEAADALVIRIQDDGPPFDLATVDEPNLDAPLEKRRIGGLGVYLMRRVMDSVELRPLGQGKEIVLCKARPGMEGAGDGHRS